MERTLEKLRDAVIHDSSSKKPSGQLINSSNHKSMKKKDKERTPSSV